MTSRSLLVSLVAAGVAAPSLALAQQRSPFPDPQIYTEELSPRQIQRAQEPDPTFDRRFPSADSRPSNFGHRPLQFSLQLLHAF